MQIASRTSSRPRLGVEMRSKLDSLSSSLCLDLTMDRLSESRRKRGRPEVRGDRGCTRNLSDVISGQYNGACKTLIRSKSSNHAVYSSQSPSLILSLHKEYVIGNVTQQPFLQRIQKDPIISLCQTRR